MVPVNLENCVEENDNTLTHREKNTTRFLELLNGDIIQQAVYNDIRPSSLRRPKLYRSSKTHKTDCPFRSILSTVGSSQHELQNF